VFEFRFATRKTRSRTLPPFSGSSEGFGLDVFPGAHEAVVAVPSTNDAEASSITWSMTSVDIAAA
jgi:hypothetical protein